MNKYPQGNKLISFRARPYAASHYTIQLNSILHTILQFYSQADFNLQYYRSIVPFKHDENKGKKKHSKFESEYAHELFMCNHDILINALKG